MWWCSSTGFPWGSFARKAWVVYAKKPFRRVDHVLKYLGRYTHRVAISNSCLVDVSEESVTFRTKNGKLASLSPVEFLRRFLQHVLPDGFHKIRHYGLYAGAAEDARHNAHRVLAPDASTATSVLVGQAPWADKLRDLTGRDIARCPRCGDDLLFRPVPATLGRAPPEAMLVAA